MNSKPLALVLFVLFLVAGIGQAEAQKSPPVLKSPQYSKMVKRGYTNLSSKEKILFKQELIRLLKKDADYIGYCKVLNEISAASATTSTPVTRTDSIRISDRWFRMSRYGSNYLEKFPELQQLPLADFGEVHFATGL